MLIKLFINDCSTFVDSEILLTRIDIPEENHLDLKIGVMES